MSTSEISSAVVAAIHTAAADGEPLLVAIAGPPGSGKSTLASAVMQECHLDAVTLPMDGFHLSNRQLDEQGLAHIKGAPQTFDRDGLLASLERLGGTTPVYFPDFSHERHEPIAASIRVEPRTELVIVEGNYLLLDDKGWRDIAEMFDLRVFIESSWSTCRERLIPRHEWAGKDPQAAREWVDRSDRANYELVMAQRIAPDMVVQQ